MPPADDPKDERLWPELTPNSEGAFSHRFVVWFPEYRRLIGIDREGLVFHSFHHTFVSRREEAGVDNVKIARIVGHKITNITAGTYGGKMFTPSKRLELIKDLELAALDGAVRLLERENREDEAAELATLSAKVRSLLKPDVARRVEPDLEALLESEGLAMRPGPRPRIDTEVVEELRQAIISCSKVKIKYRNRSNRRTNERLVHPYGFLHGHRNYLVAYHEHEKANKVVLFALPNIESVELTKHTFTREPNFSLETFASQSFGLFQAEQFRTVWKFSPDAADDAAEFNFHPSQTIERLADGSLLVSLVAASMIEMAWHLYSWGDLVEVLEPPELAEMVNTRRVSWGARP